MVYYKEVPEVNKRMVAGYYLFLCLLGFAVLLGPTGSGIPVTLIGTSDRDRHESLIAQPGWGTDPSDCTGSGCHDNRHGNWTGSAHERAAVWNGTHVLIGGLEFPFTIFTEAAWNASSCAECHTTNWDNSTGTPTYDALGVDCFACHNVSAAEWVDYSGQSCQSCHEGDVLGDHPHQVPWQASAHANSLTDLRTSSHAASYCMHCQATEAFIHQQNPGELATTSPNVDLGFAVDGDYNSISCPACHAVHSNWTGVSEHYVRAANSSELCGLCHVGSRHPMYTVWLGGPHDLALVECVDCHGYDLTVESSDPFFNHSFVVKPDIACGQSAECHEGMETWALGQLDMIEHAFDALVAEFETEAAALQAIVDTYNATAGADHAVANYVDAAISDAESVVNLYKEDGSHGFHHPMMIFEDINAAYRDLIDAKSYFYENTDTGPMTTVTNTVTVTVTAPPVPGGDTLLLIGGSVGGIVVGLVLGILVGRRR